MLTKILEIRAWILKVYQRVRTVLNPAAKFVFSLLIFMWINDKMGFDPKFTKPVISVLLAAVSAFTPSGVLVFLAMGLTLIHIYAVSSTTSLLLVILVVLVYIILYGFMMRFTPKQVIVAVAVPFLMSSNLHFAVPMLLGCVANPLSVLPTASGIIAYNLLEIAVRARTRQIETNIDDVVQLYTDVIDALVANKEMFVMIVVFALVITVVWAIRRIPLDYAFEISIGAGVMTNILGFLIADLKFDVTVEIGNLILMSIVCGLIAMLCDYMKRILDYTAIERVQFEDDDYYYYVKAVPKVNISLRKLDIKHFHRKAVDDEEYEYEEETEDGDYESNDEVEKKSRMSLFARLGKKDKKKDEEIEEEYDLDELDDDSDMKIASGANSDKYSRESYERGYESENEVLVDSKSDEDEIDSFVNIDISDMLSVDDDEDNK